MPEVTEGVYFIPGQDEMIPDSHVYIIGKPSSHDLSLIDAGLMGKGGYKVKAILEMGLNLEDIKRVIMTHTHLDHIGCLEEIRRQIPGVELWVHDLGAGALEAGDERAVYGMDMFRGMCQMQFNIKDGASTFKVDKRPVDGEILEIGDMVWEVCHIPGHSAGSIALYDPAGKTLIPGDTVYADYAIGRFDLHGAAGGDLKASLMRLAELEVDILLPGHNRIVKEVREGYIRETAKQWAPHLG